MGLDRPARPVAADAEHETWIWALERPLAPGDTVRLRFDLAYEPRGFVNEGGVVVLARNGTFIEREWFPFIGYQRSAEVEAPAARRDAGLGPREPLPPATDSAGLWRVGSSADADLITLDVVVGTAPDQVAASAGVPVREWTEGGRRWFHFRSPRPTANTWAVLSARYAARERTTPDGVKVRVLHHPAHGANVGRILGAAERSLEHYTRAFGPNPYREVQIVEFPRYSQRATAFPGLIALSESFGFLSRVDDAAGDLDTPLMVTAHELAHQWWGGQVMPAAVLGRQVLTETLANYSAMSVMHLAHGDAQVDAFRRLQLIEYLNRRGRGDQPLLTTGDADNVHYRKGALVMWTLREYLGQARVDSALRGLLARHAFRGPPYPTSHDLLRELRAVTPDSAAWLLADLFETITIWDLRTNAARADSLGGGRWRVTLEVEAAKFRVDSLGRDSAAPMDDLVEIGVYGDGGGKPLHLATRRLGAGRHAVVVEVEGKPARAGIDPRFLLVPRRGDDLSDNVRDVRERGG
jgi:aminopeptidase N